ncbi:MAG TPA: hypothetical protein VFR49_02940, partial [Solirubrobacteraceae bacterium]|nr:hypothetical protein [Solirubrobacteraceae bacterium]
MYEAPDLAGINVLVPGAAERVPFEEPTSTTDAPGEAVPVTVRLPTHAPESIVGMPSNVTDELGPPFEKRTTSPASSGPAYSASATPQEPLFKAITAPPRITSMAEPELEEFGGFVHATTCECVDVRTRENVYVGGPAGG